MTLKYLKQVELQKMFDIGSTYCTRICRAIDNHQEIYSEWAKNGTRYEICAFVHASKYLSELENNLQVPEFIPERIEEVLRAHEFKEERNYAEHEVKLHLADKVNEWFRVTEIPKNISANEVAKIIKKAMLAIVTE